MSLASTPQPPTAHARPIQPRPALRPILPKPPSVAPVDRTAAASTAASVTSTLTAKGPAQTSLSHLGSRVIGSVASSIFAGSTTITLPPRPSASRSKAKKRASPDRVLVISPDADKKQDMAVSNAAALKKRRRAKLTSLAASAPAAAPVALGSLKPMSSTASESSSASVSTRASSVASPAPGPASGPAVSAASPSSSAAASLAASAVTATPATPLRHSAGTRPGIAIPHTTPQSESTAAFSAFDLDILSPDAFSLPAPSSDIWWPRLDDSSSVGVYDSDISISSSSSSTLASAAAAARRNLDRASSTSSLSSSLSSSTYFSDSTISTAVSSIVIDEEPEFDSEPAKRVESEISDMIHRLITGDDKRQPIDDEDEEEMLFATPTDTSSVRQARAESEGARPRAQKQDSLRQLFSISSSISSNAQLKSSESTATPIPSLNPGKSARAASEPASITIPAEKNSFEDESEMDFILNRELLVKKGLGKSKVSKHHVPAQFSTSTSDVTTAVDHSERAISGIINEDLFAEDDDDEMISSTTSHESGSMDVDIDGTSGGLFGGLDDFGLADDEQDPFTFLDVVGGTSGNEVVESAVGW
ncbi:hypothetical protein V1517DRAFT_318264 [Lipomyces orientalis]|uniref:Uncharacterized protein n=1 Tax=Lipomyces orientalis TaxID=1233043 RepID=A0ACC3TUE3_9ASCO